MENQEIVKVANVKVNFTVIGNNIIQDEGLSIESRFILIYLRHLPSDWICNKSDIQKRLKIGRRIVDRCFDELYKAGYLVQVDMVHSGSLFTTKGYLAYPYSIYEEPITLYSTDVQNVQRQNDNTSITQNPFDVQNVQRSDSTDVQNVQLLNTNSNNIITKNKKQNRGNTIEERRQWLSKGLEPFLEKYGKDMLHSFYVWWTEPNDSGSKLRMDKEEFFNIPGRLATWHSRSETRGKFAAPAARPAVPASQSPMANQDNHSNYADYVAWCERNNVTPDPERP
jgi:hypothetical protein